MRRTLLPPEVIERPRNFLGSRPIFRLDGPGTFVFGTDPEASNPSGGEFIPLGALAVSAQNVDLGRVPLNKEVTQIFRVRNISQEPVRLGKVMVNVLEGC